MNKLRKLIKAVNKYVDLICDKPEKAKWDCTFYLTDVENLQNQVNNYILETEEKFQKGCNTSTELSLSQEKNIFARLKSAIKIIIINNLLNIYSKNLSSARILLRNLDFIHRRLTQFNTLLNLH